MCQGILTASVNSFLKSFWAYILWPVCDIVHVWMEHFCAWASQGTISISASGWAGKHM